MTNNQLLMWHYHCRMAEEMHNKLDCVYHFNECSKFARVVRLHYTKRKKIHDFLVGLLENIGLDLYWMFDIKYYNPGGEPLSLPFIAPNLTTKEILAKENLPTQQELHKDFKEMLDEPHVCNCSKFDVINFGCKCGGV